MEANMYPQNNQEQGNTDALPSYDETINQHPYPTGSADPSTANIPSPLIKMSPQPQQQQPPINLVQNLTLHTLGPPQSLLVPPSFHQQQNTKLPTESFLRTYLFVTILRCLGCCCCACLCLSFFTY